MLGILKTQWVSLLTLILVGINILLTTISAIVMYYIFNSNQGSLSEESLHSIVEIYKEWPDENRHYFNCNEFNPDFYNGLFKK